MGKRQRDRIKAAKAKRAGIVALNMASPMPPLPSALVRFRDGSVSLVRGKSVSNDHVGRLQASTSSPGFRSNLRGGNPEDREVVAVVRRYNAAAETSPTFAKQAPITHTPEGREVHERKPVPPMTGETATRFAKSNAYQAAEREASRERKRQAEVNEALRLTRERFKRMNWPTKG